jgi:DNA-binding NarL/FixJ family response regulator
MNNSLSYRLSVLVMHADPIVCAGVVAALRQHPVFDVSIRRTDESEDDGERIDVAITDYDNAIRLTDRGARATRGRLANARILALTANDREADIRRAIRNGIHGYLVLGGSLDELVDAVGAVGMGVRYLCPIVAQRIADSLAGEALTQRENEVLRLVATGQSNKAIARQLTIELGTVKSHVSAIMTKLGAISRTQAASIAVTRGLVDERRPRPPTYPSPSNVSSVEVQPQFA